MNMIPRPEINSVTRRTEKVKVCRSCGYQIDKTTLMLCDYGCPEDGSFHSNPIIAVYDVAYTFLGDEPLHK
jgi:hypothetical protein